jgi:hypothetical protein
MEKRKHEKYRNIQETFVPVKARLYNPFMLHDVHPDLVSDGEIKY